MTSRETSPKALAPPGAVTAAARRVEDTLDRAMPRADATPATLNGGMRYAIFGGGKRLRPALVYAGAELAGASAGNVDAAAAAVELIHGYSLVHDDLPAMDDDDLRHGQPATHVQYGEALGILIGDALQSLAFDVLVRGAPAGRARDWTLLLAGAAGAAGMAGGQVLDLAAERPGTSLTVDELESLHRRKTGALIRASVMLGATSGSLGDGELASVDAFAKEIGLAFQIHDDVLDVVASTEVLGKPQGSDERQGKTTYVTLLGLDGARREAEARFRAACGHLDRFAARADSLRAIARHVVERNR